MARATADAAPSSAKPGKRPRNEQSGAAGAAATPAAAEAPAQARAERLAINSDYFDAMLSLIPAKYYLQGDAQDEEEDVAAARFYKNKKGTLPKQPIKSKASKRVRFDVGAAMTVPELQEAAAAEAEDAEGDEAGDAAAGTKRRRPEDAADLGMRIPSAKPAASIEELRARLHARLDEMRRNRRPTRLPDAGMSDEEPMDEDEPSGKPMKKSRDSKAKPTADKAEKKPIERADKSGADKGKHAPKAQKAATVAAKKVEKRADAPAPAAARTPAAAPPPAASQSLDFAFGAISGVPAAAADAGSVSSGGDAKASKKTKQQRLKQMLEDAKRKQKKLETLAAKGDKAAKVAAAFDTALKRASGEKVHDDPVRLAKRLKRMASKKAKSAAKWAERTEKQSKDRETVQAARAEARKTKKIRGLISKEVAKERQKAKEREEAASSKAGAATTPHGGKSGPPAAAAGGSKPRAGFEGKKKAFVNRSGGAK